MTGSFLRDISDTQFYYNIICPSLLFNAASRTDGLCKVGDDGFFRLSPSQISQLPLRYSVPFTFTVLIGIKDTNIVRQINA